MNGNKFRRLRFWVVLALVFSLVGGFALYFTSYRSKSPLVVLLGVEGLNQEQSPCKDPLASSLNLEHLSLFCKEGVQLTKAFAPTTMSQATWASVFSGRRLEAHSVVHNGAQFLSNTVVTLAEEAVLRGWRTAFFSGGPPLLAKSGLQQGFEVFDDLIPSDTLYRPSLKLLEQVESYIWKQSRPTLVSVFLADMQFPHIKVFSSLDEKELPREAASQKQKLIVAIDGFLGRLYEHKKHSSLRVVLFGLNGPFRPREKRLAQENLHRERVQVPVIFSSESVSKESVNELFSLTQIYDLALNWVSQKRLSPQPIELKGAPSLMISSFWSTWLFGWRPHWSWRSDERVVFSQEPNNYFEASTDLHEDNPLPMEESFLKEQDVWRSSFRHYSAYPEGRGGQDEFYRFLLHQSQSLAVENSQALLPSTDYGQRLLSDRMLSQKKWQEIVKTPWASEPLKSVAQHHLRQEKESSWWDFCGEVICEDDLLVSLKAWEESLGSPRESRMELHFVRKFRQFTRLKTAAYVNLLNQMSWDVPSDLLLGPHQVELYLHLPSSRYLLQRIQSYGLSGAVGSADLLLSPLTDG